MNGLTSTWRDRIRPYLFILPAMIFLVVFTIYPLGNLVYLSFTDWNLVNPVKNWKGISNYKYLFGRKDFNIALTNTFYYTFWNVLLLLGLAVIIAVWLKKDTKINGFLRTAMFTPHVIALLSISMVWAWLMNENEGLLNMILSAVGLPTSRWLQSSDTAMNSILVVSVWKGLGYYVMIVFAALQGIPAEIYEAADLDNASAVSRFFKITLPMISPQLFMLLITMTIGSFKVFETIRIMTGGGPGTSTQVLVFYIYQQAFTYLKVGLACAAGTILLVIVGVMTIVYFAVLARRVHYQ